MCIYHFSMKNEKNYLRRKAQLDKAHPKWAPSKNLRKIEVFQSRAPRIWLRSLNTIVGKYLPPSSRPPRGHEDIYIYIYIYVYTKYEHESMKI